MSLSNFDVESLTFAYSCPLCQIKKSKNNHADYTNTEIMEIRKMKKRLENPFEHVSVNKEDTKKMNDIKSFMTSLYYYLMDNVQLCRERSVAITKLEEASMWINKAISRVDNN